MKTAKIIFMVVVLIIIIGLVWWTNQNKTENTPTPSTDQTETGGTTPVVVGAGEHCGGNIMNAPICNAGLHCAPNADSSLPFGDVGGTCVAD